MSDDDDTGYSPAKTSGILALVIASGVVLGGVLVVLVMGGGEKTPAGPTLAAAAKAERDPYPECAPIRTWLREKEGAVQIVSWGKRSTQRSDAGQSTTLTVWFNRPEGRKLRGFFRVANGAVEFGVIDD